jgi:N-formylglutamate amidohydrolase
MPPGLMGTDAVWGSLSPLVTCEHGGNRVPDAWRHRFAGAQDVLWSQRGYDKGALRLATTLASALGAPLVASTTTRLLVDPARSPDDPGLFSEWTRDLPTEEKKRVLAEHYAPHRQEVQRLAESLAPVLHLAVCSLAGGAEVRLRCDGERKRERELCLALKRELGAVDPSLRVAEDLGAASAVGLAGHLRRTLPPEGYLGVDVELDADVADEPRRAEAVAHALTAALARVRAA